jgi:dolichyl-phosphate-mannose-protein mannosyltransferase
MDVHPPLAKLLITLSAWLAGFDGEFDFKDIGKDYLEPGVPYVAMRLLPAILGVLTAPLMFLILKVTGCRTATAVMGAVLVTFGMVVTSLVLNPVKRRSDRSKRMHSRLSLVLSFSTLRLSSAPPLPCYPFPASRISRNRAPRKHSADHGGFG